MEVSTEFYKRMEHLNHSSTYLLTDLLTDTYTHAGVHMVPVWHRGKDPQGAWRRSYLSIARHNANGCACNQRGSAAQWISRIELKVVELREVAVQHGTNERMAGVGKPIQRCV